MKTFIALIQLMVLCPTKFQIPQNHCHLHTTKFSSKTTEREIIYVRDLSRRRNDLSRRRNK